MAKSRPTRAAASPAVAASPQLDTTEYADLLGAVKERIRTAQYEVLRAVNARLVALYWDIGRIIVERQSTEGWGRGVVEQLSTDLQTEFPGVTGYSPQNLWYMRQLYLTYRESRDLQPLVGEVSWSHNLIILSKCKDTAERAFYLYTARRERWSKSTLIRQIEAGLYRRTRTSQTNFGAVLPPDRHPQAELVVKDEYVLDFLTLTDQHSERELESAIMANLERFLCEMGGAFTFVGRQYPLRVNDTEYFVDLLFYHRRLKSLVAVELKTGAFRPEFIGKMQFYLALLDDTIRVEDERPSMGIILCKTRDKTIVEYALRESRKPIGVAGYRMVSTLPQELRDQFPGPDQVARLLDGVSDIQSVSAVPTTTLGHPSP